MSVKGLFHLVKLPRINSLTCHFPETLDLAFKLRRKKFTIEVCINFITFLINFKNCCPCMNLIHFLKGHSLMIFICERNQSGTIRNLAFNFQKKIGLAPAKIQVNHGFNFVYWISLAEYTTKYKTTVIIYCCICNTLLNNLDKIFI